MPLFLVQVAVGTERSCSTVPGIFSVLMGFFFLHQPTIRSVGWFNILTRSQVIHEFGPENTRSFSLKTLPNTHKLVNRKKISDNAQHTNAPK